MDIREVEEHVKYRIANTSVREYPYPHFFVENVFPEEYYRQILDLWPGVEYFRSIAETGRTTGYKERFIISLLELDRQDEAWAARRFWKEFSSWFCGPTFLQFLVTHYQPWILRGRKLPQQISISADGLLVQDHTNYAIGPHTDAVHRLVSTLFYCPADESQRHLGTSVYVPQGNDIPREISGSHHPRDRFFKVETMPFIPNSMFGFVVGPNSFHGVDQIHDEDVKRNVILHFAKLQGV
ncbi:MAG: hypothetical protein ACOY33_05060 [Pseudomonadota bacterium]